MRRALGVLLLLVAVVLGGIGALWTLMKANGAEVDLSIGDGYTSGWYPASGLLACALLVAALGVALLRGQRDGSRTREGLR